jgi:geranylgeranylglycerol-phosphate geranylgeranyltransferase
MIQMNSNIKLKKNNNNISINKFKSYIKLTRPNAILYEFGLPVTGSYLISNNINIFFNPTVILLGFISILIGSNSMVINDYYDYKNGVDSEKKNKILNLGYLTSEQVLHFSYLLNILTFYLISFINNNLIRNILSTNIILTYLYTPILKPIPFVKNFIVSFIISQSLIVGALIIDYNLIKILPHIFYLFNYILWQEIILDATDIRGDKLSNIYTIPVLLGIKKSYIIALIFLLFGTFIPFGFNFLFILLQTPTLFITIYSIIKNVIISNKFIKFSNFFMLLSGIYLCYL